MNERSPDPHAAFPGVERAAVPAPRSPEVGERIGAYRLVRLVGEGAGGRVFEVLHETLGRRAACKLLGAAQAARPVARARFLAEALSINRINHPHIVEVTDVVETAEHEALVMELLEGQSLGAAMMQGPLPPQRFLPILAQVCEALAAAHAAGFVHRDLKPENIFLCERPGAPDFVKLLDFGVAMIVAPPSPAAAPGAQDPRGPSTPRPGTFVGTPAYASPEQASGGHVDHTTDIYAVGVILYELACGRLPFEGWTVGQFVIQHLSAPAPRLPAELRATPLGRALDAIVQGCMAKRPADRFAFAAGLSATFASLARGESIPISTGVPRLTPRRLGRSFWRAATAALAALALAWFCASRLGRGPRVAPRAPRVPAQVSGAPAATTTSEASTALVTIVFETEPAGAEVRLAREGELLGVTPFRRAFPRRDDELLLEVSLARYEPARLAVSTRTARTLSVTLARRAPPPPRKGSHRLGSEKTIDPFRR
jgi:serine/threonine protein kinase